MAARQAQTARVVDLLHFAVHHPAAPVTPMLAQAAQLLATLPHDTPVHFDHDITAFNDSFASVGKISESTNVLGTLLPLMRNQRRYARSR